MNEPILQRSETPKSPPRIGCLSVHPFKGLSTHNVKEAVLRSPGGLENDRMYAFAYAALVPPGTEPADLSALPKPALLQQNDWPALGRLGLSFDSARGLVSLRDSTVQRGSAASGSLAAVENVDPDTLHGRAALEEFMNAFLAREERAVHALGKSEPRVRLVGSRALSSRFPDRAAADVTFVSARTLADLEARFGAPIDARRFRINLIVDGLEAWSEETLVGQEIAVGEAVLRVKGPVRRCFNINVHPDEGTRDIGLLEWLKPNLGHTVIGYTALVEKPGRIALGNAFMVQKM